MIALSLGGGQEIRLYFQRHRAVRGDVLHRPSPHSRRLCTTTLDLVDRWGDGPTGFSLDNFTCETCGRTMRIRGSTLVGQAQRSASHGLKKRGLRIIR